MDGRVRGENIYNMRRRARGLCDGIKGMDETVTRKDRESKGAVSSSLPGRQPWHASRRAFRRRRSPRP